jgi:hypothetical protein
LDKKLVGAKKGRRWGWRFYCDKLAEANSDLEIWLLQFFHNYHNPVSSRLLILSNISYCIKSYSDHKIYRKPGEGETGAYRGQLADGSLFAPKIGAFTEGFLRLN